MFFLILWFHVSDGACLDNSTKIIIEMTGLHGSLRYVVYIFMNAVFIFLSSLVGYNWRIFEYFSQQRLILYELPVLQRTISCRRAKIKQACHFYYYHRRLKERWEGKIGRGRWSAGARSSSPSFGSSRNLSSPTLRRKDCVTIQKSICKGSFEAREKRGKGRTN